MFYCEANAEWLCNEVAKCPREAQQAALDAYVRDYVAVVIHYLRDPAYPYSTTTPRAVMEASAERRPVTLPVLNKMCGHVLFELQWRAGAQPLSTEEIELLEAARRLSNSIHGRPQH